MRISYGRGAARRGRGGEQGWLQGRGPDHMVLGPIHGAASVLSLDGSSRISKGEGAPTTLSGQGQNYQKGWAGREQPRWDRRHKPATRQAPPTARCLSGVCVCV